MPPPPYLGLGASASFDTFFRIVHAKSKFDADRVCIFHISLPGHEELQNGGGDMDPTEAAASNSRSQFPGVDEMSTAVAEVSIYRSIFEMPLHGLEIAIGIGIGIGISIGSGSGSGSGIGSGVVLLGVVPRCQAVPMKLQFCHSAARFDSGTNLSMALVSSVLVAGHCWLQKCGWHCYLALALDLTLVWLCLSPCVFVCMYVSIPQVIKECKLGFPVGLGVGVGADILFRAA